MGLMDISNADRSGEEGDAGDFDDVRRSQKCVNDRTADHFVRGRAQEGQANTAAAKAQASCQGQRWRCGLVGHTSGGRTWSW